MIKRISKTIVVFMIICEMIVQPGIFTYTDAAAIESTQIDYKPSNMCYSLRVNDKGQLYYYSEISYDQYALFTVKNNGKTKKRELTLDETYQYSTIFQNEKNEFLISHQISQKKWGIEKYNKNGKKIFEFTYKIKKNPDKRADISFIDFCEDDKYIYYSYSDRNSKLFMNRLNKKTKSLKTKVLSRDKLEGIPNSIQEMKYIDNKAYIIQRKSILEYSLTGKKLNEYKIPDEEIYFTSEADVKDCLPLSKFNAFDKFGKYLYYCNTKGVYRCNLNQNNEFELYYDAANDKCFNNKYLLLDFKVVDNNTYYMLLNKTELIDNFVSTELIKYTN